MNLIPWRRGYPLSTDLDELFSRFWGDGEGTNRLPEVFHGRGMPAVNVSETEDSFDVAVDCPGMSEKDLQVEAMGNHLVISGERKWEEEKKGKEYRRVESQFGRFQRAVALPQNVRIEPSEIEASYKKGVLTIRIPKHEKPPSTQIPVRGG
jgi:HSP20 family protein